ncbi:PKD domain-containing protein [Marinigracilibium pacificum]|uniref:PKD domain-containing protein n=1 Tax=Marinigracilibium pacificum TaxID=2729599 RepID=A0A848J2P2_9BACT|nr:PKD domain-containing protein [Marinigracilibium pacificum]NMM48810.1 PKD domain-containing protein [Marinigracilibium pacificum]
MRNYFVVILFLVVFSNEVISQCEDLNFDTPEIVCINEVFEISSTDQQYHYSIDYSAGDFLNGQLNTDFILNDNEFYRARSLKIVKDGSNYVGFAISQTSNKIIRLNFGPSLENVPKISYIDNNQGLLSGPFGFDLLEVDGIWFMLIANTTKNNILKVKFNQGLDSNDLSISEVNVQTPVNSPNDIKFIKYDGKNIYVAVTGNEELLIIDFQNGIANDPLSNKYSLTGHTLRGIDFINLCGTYTGYVLSYSKNQLLKLDFGSDLMSQPEVNKINLSGSQLYFPASIDIKYEIGGYFAFIQGALGNTYRVKIGDDISKSNLTNEELNLPTSDQGFSLEVIQDNSEWYLFVIDLKSRQLVRVSYDSPNTAEKSFIDQNGFKINSFDFAGRKYLIFKYLNGNGDVEYKIDSIDVGKDISPQVSIKMDSLNCIGTNVELSGYPDNSVDSWQWQFGDGNSSSGQNVVHQYQADGSYPIRLDVANSVTGCKNIVFDTVMIFPKPVADFGYSENLICSNNTVSFVNSSVLEGAEGNERFSWFVDELKISEDENLDYKFVSSGFHEVKLITSIPGCSDSASIQVEVNEGPKANFTFKEECEDSFISFSDKSSGVNILSRLWSFGNGDMATNLNPKIYYKEDGYYAISLKVLSENGCENIKYDTLKVHDNPVPSFVSSLLCENVPVQFNDETKINEDEIVSWKWTINNELASSSKRPSLTFDSSGKYQIGLTVKSQFGCESVVIRDVTISDTPNVDFEIENACSDSYVSFLDNSSVGEDSIKSWLWTIDGKEYLSEDVKRFYSNVGEYYASLRVVSSNLCVNEITKTFNIGQSPISAFSYENPCEGEESNFISEANDVVGYHWIFDNQVVKEGSLVNWTFSKAGNHNVSHVVVSDNGCTDTLTKIVDINKVPEIEFSVANKVGGAPFLVSFDNNSKYAESFIWDLEGDGKVKSNIEKPTHLYEFRGNYKVSLTGISPDGCESTGYINLSVVNPEVDLQISSIELVNNQEGKFLSIEIRNNGNTREENVIVELDLGNGELINKVVPFPIEIGSNNYYLFPVNDEILNDNKTLCANLSFGSESNDLNPSNNRLCLYLNDHTINAYFSKNPSADNAFILLSSKVNSEAQVSVFSYSGAILYDREYNLITGMNHLMFEAEKLSPGVYPISIVVDGQKIVLKFIKQ